MAERPDYCSDAMLEYLDGLRESGVTNMFGARPYVKREYPVLNDREAAKVLTYWMESFGERRPNG